MKIRTNIVVPDKNFFLIHKLSLARYSDPSNFLDKCPDGSTVDKGFQEDLWFDLRKVVKDGVEYSPTDLLLNTNIEPTPMFKEYDIPYSVPFYKQFGVYTVEYAIGFTTDATGERMVDTDLKTFNLNYTRGCNVDIIPPSGLADNYTHYADKEPVTVYFVGAQGGNCVGWSTTVDVGRVTDSGI